MITDQDGVVLDVNEAFSKITGYERAEVIGSTPRLLDSGFLPPQIYQDMWARLVRAVSDQSFCNPASQLSQ